jgi:hypothetical protein
MTSIRFSDNNLTEISLMSIAPYFCSHQQDSLKARKKLIHLELVNNGLTNESLETIATVIFKENKGLKIVDLSYNWIGT